MDNRLDERIAPLSADFNFYGGIYRDVYLTAVEDVHVDMKELGASGLYLTTPNAGLTSVERPDDLGRLNIKARISNDSDRTRNITVKAAVKGDNAPQPVTQTISIPAGGSVEFNKDTTIKDPHLWKGIRYEEDETNEDVGYQYEVELTLSEGNQVLDCVNEKVGFRWFYLDKDKGFYLNGESYPLRGVNRHQEKEGYGNAITNEEHYADLKDMMEMGVNTIRLCHYPQANYFYDLCDANGIIV